MKTNFYIITIFARYSQMVCGVTICYCLSFHILETQKTTRFPWRYTGMTRIPNNWTILLMYKVYNHIYSLLSFGFFLTKHKQRFWCWNEIIFYHFKLLCTSVTKWLVVVGNAWPRMRRTPVGGVTHLTNAA